MKTRKITILGIFLLTFFGYSAGYASTRAKVRGESTLKDVSLRLSGVLDHTCRVNGDGTVSCWGENDFGALGDGTSETRTAPVKVVNLNAAVAVAVGVNHSCALLSTGTVRCWGSNFSGQLGDGAAETFQVRPPVTVAGITNAVAITSGWHHTCALLADGTEIGRAHV